MASLWITLEVAPGRRGELLDAIRHAISTAPYGPKALNVYEGIGAPHRVACHGQWESGERLSTFLEGAAFRTIRGAARVLDADYTVERVGTVTHHAPPRSDGARGSRGS